MKLEGQCLCGSVHYTSLAPPLFVFLCHCRDCQRSGGSLTHFGIMVPEAGFTRTGEVRSYDKPADSGRRLTREFCPTCGTGINNRLEMVPGVVVIKGGTLDDPSVIAPTFELYARTKLVSWCDGADLPSFEADLKGDISKLGWRPPG